MPNQVQNSQSREPFQQGLDLPTLSLRRHLWSLAESRSYRARSGSLPSLPNPSEEGFHSTAGAETLQNHVIMVFENKTARFPASASNPLHTRPYRGNSQPDRPLLGANIIPVSFGQRSCKHLRIQQLIKTWCPTPKMAMRRLPWARASSTSAHPTPTSTYLALGLHPTETRAQGSHPYSIY